MWTIMDLWTCPLGGADNTSLARPALMWVNNDHDEPASGNQPDRDLNDWGNPPQNPPDYTYGAIRCQRNLEDFARLWICGVPTLPTNQAYSVQLAWSQISSGAPRMRLYWASETNGGIGYLTNTATAGQQIAQYNFPIGEITPTSSLTLPTSWFTNGLPRYFLFEAGAAGKGALTLTILQGTNTIAQTSAWLDFHDIRDLYEQALVTNVIQTWPEMVQTNLDSGFEVLSYATANTGDAKQLAVFVHGWRMTDFDLGHLFANDVEAALLAGVPGPVCFVALADTLRRHRRGEEWICSPTIVANTSRLNRARVRHSTSTICASDSRTTRSASAHTARVVSL